MWIKFRDELNTCLKIVHQIFSVIKKYVKYLYISNNIFTMMSAPDKKCVRSFQQFFANKYHIFYQYGVWTFVSWILKLFHQSKLELWGSKLRKNWAFTFQSFESSMLWKATSNLFAIYSKLMQIICFYKMCKMCGV